MQDKAKTNANAKKKAKLKARQSKYKAMQKHET